MHVRERDSEVLAVVAFRPHGRLKFGPCVHQLGVAGHHEIDHAVGRRFDILVDPGDAVRRRRIDRPGIDRNPAQNGTEQRRFSRAVGSHQPDPLAGRRRDVDVPVQRTSTSVQAQPGQAEHRLGRLKKSATLPAFALRASGGKRPGGCGADAGLPAEAHSAKAGQAATERVASA